MGTFGDRAGEARIRDMILTLVAVFGLSMSITFVWLGMRAVMSIGGACADGGPFVPAQPCPAGVPALLTLGMFGLFGFGALGMYAGAAIGGNWVALPLLGWPALFLSLGWNFIEFGLNPGAGLGWEWGWLLPGTIFIVMGAVPLVVAWSTRSSATPVARRFGMPSSPDRKDPPPSLGWDPSHRVAPPRPEPAPGAATHPARTADPPGPAEVSGADVVDRLERLADLRRRGDLTSAEFERFKGALLRDAEDP